MPFDPNRHHRRSIRLPGYDYTQPGVFFVTICAAQRLTVFGSILDKAMHLSHPGQIVANCWIALPQHFPRILLDAWILMPDHLHGVLILQESATAVARATHMLEARPAHANGTQPDSLNAIMQNFKSISTRKVNQLCRTPGARLWQRDYYERIVRDERELHNIRCYIESNPAHWGSGPR